VALAAEAERQGVAAVDHAELLVRRLCLVDHLALERVAGRAADGGDDQQDGHAARDGPSAGAQQPAHDDGGQHRHHAEGECDLVDAQRRDQEIRRRERADNAPDGPEHVDVPRGRYPVDAGEFRGVGTDVAERVRRRAKEDDDRRERGGLCRQRDVDRSPEDGVAELDQPRDGRS
jgi:hypothetical protein